MRVMQKDEDFKKLYLSEQKRRETIKNGRPRGHSFDHRFILLYFGGKMRPCSLCWKQKTWREAVFSFKYDFLKKQKNHKMARNLWNEDLPIPFLTQCFFTCREGVCLIKLEPVQNKRDGFLYSYLRPVIFWLLMPGRNQGTAITYLSITHAWFTLGKIRMDGSNFYLHMATKTLAPTLPMQFTEW